MEGYSQVVQLKQVSMWYSASLFFQSVHNGGPTDHDVWELQVVLIRSETEAEATILAAQIGKSKEHEYVSATGDHVRWIFRHVQTVFQLFDEQLASGTELFSQFLSSSEVESLLKPLQNVRDNV